jgi:hypothetical protein
VTRFASPWDRGLAWSTALLLALLAAIGIGLPALVARDAPELVGLLLLLPAGLAALVLACWGLAPRGFALEGGQVRVERWLRPVVFPLASVRAVAVLGPDALRGSLRLGGTSGLFGHFGHFWSRDLGAYRLYATSSRRLVLVDTAGGRFVLSPEPAKRFAEEVLARAPAAARTAQLAPAGPVPRGLRRALWAVGLAVPLAVALPLALGWGFGPRAAAVEGNALRIERNWATPVEIPLASIRGVRWLRPEDQAGWRRTGGVAMGGLRYGSWASPTLGRFRLYAWGPGPLLVLEMETETGTEAGRVVITADPPEPFAEALRACLPR